MRGALWAVGFMIAAGGFGFGALCVAGAAMSDSPSGSADTMTTAKLCGGVGVVGLVLIGAGFAF